MTLKLEDVPVNELDDHCICYNCLQLIHYFDISFVSHNQDDPHNILSCCIPCESILKMSRININGAERQKHMKEYLDNINKKCVVLDDKECDCYTSDESNESTQDEHSESESEEEETKKETSDEEKESEKPKKNKNVKSIKLEFWISL